MIVASARRDQACVCLSANGALIVVFGNVAWLGKAVLRSSLKSVRETCVPLCCGGRSSCATTCLPPALASHCLILCCSSQLDERCALLRALRDVARRKATRFWGQRSKREAEEQTRGGWGAGCVCGRSLALPAPRRRDEMANGGMAMAVGAVQHGRPHSQVRYKKGTKEGIVS